MKKHVTLFSSVLMMSTTLLGAGGVFAAEQAVSPSPADASTPISTTLTINESPEKPTVPDKGEGGGEETEISGVYGIAYTPGSLSGQKLLGDSGEERIDLTNNTNETAKHNVGVQDKTRKNKQTWSLKAQLVWTDDTNNYMKGTKITASNGNVKENKKGTLEPLADGEVETAATTLNIEQSSEVEVMKAVSGKTMNGVYNYQFENPQLVIPDVSKVAAGTFSGQINWNLEDTPSLPQ